MLDGIKVVESGREPAVRFCGWLFAMNGASVVRLADGDAPGADHWSEVFLNAAKRVVSPADGAGALAEADVVLGGTGFDWSSADASRQVTGTVDAFGADGPYAGMRGGELIYTSLGGASGYTFTREGEPVYGYGDRYQYLTGAFLFQSVVACLLEGDLRGGAPGSGPGSGSVPRVRVSDFEAVVALLPYLTTQYEYNGSASVLEQSGPRFVSRCKDGFVVIYAGFGWEPIAATLDRPDLLGDERFVENDARFANIPALGEVFDAWAAARTVDEACRAGEEHNVAVTAIRDPDAVLAEASLAVRGAWFPVRDGDREGRIPALPYTIDNHRPHKPPTPGTTPEGDSGGSSANMGKDFPDETAGRRRKILPRNCGSPGPGSGSGLGPGSSLARGSGPGSGPGAGLPLAGYRVLDLTHVWSGPMATRVLAGLGAEVIKLEGTGKPDRMRGNPGDIRLRYPDMTPGPDSINRNAWFNTTNVDKRGVVLDLKSDEGRRIAYELVAASDIVIANYRPGVLDRMGLGFADLARVNPEIVLVEMPGYTADSPQAAAPAFGAQFDAQSGSATLTGSPDGPLLTGFALGDPVSGLLAGAAALAALVRRNRTGAPGHVVLAQSEAMMPLLGEYYLAESLGEPMREEINADRRFFPHGLYATADGSHVAVAVTSDEQWLALRTLLTTPTTKSPGREGTGTGGTSDVGSGVRAGPDLLEVVTLEDRRRVAARIDAAVRAFVGAEPDATLAAAKLQVAGVPAAPSQGAAELVEDPQLAHAGFFTRLEHPSVGIHRYPGLPILIDGVRCGTRRPAPRFGEDTAAVMAGVLGMPNAEVERLAATGVLGLLARTPS